MDWVLHDSDAEGVISGVSSLVLLVGHTFGSDADVLRREELESSPRIILSGKSMLFLLLSQDISTRNRVDLPLPVKGS